MSMRWRVDFPNSYISYGEQDYDAAFTAYKEHGIRLLKCKDIHDRGTVIEGPPIFEDLTRKPWEEN